MLLLAGFLDLLPEIVAVAAATATVALVVGVRLIRLALTIRAVYGTRLGTCRGAGLLGIGVLAGGLAVAALPLVAPASRAGVAVGGLAVAVLAYLLGMLLLPGAATTVATRVRRGFDGLSIGITLAFAGWLMPPAGPMPPAALAAALIAAAGISVVTVTALRAARYRPAALLSGSGSGAAMTGLAALAMVIAYGGPQWAMLVAAAPLVFGPVVISIGAHRAPAGPPPPPTIEAESRLSAYPLLSVPAMVATLAAVYHLVTVGHFDHTSIVLGLAGIPAMVVREVLAAMDIRGYARRLARQEAHFRSMVSGGNDLTMVVGEDLLVRWQSPAAARLFGLSDADVIGRSFGELMHPDDAADVTTLLTAVLAQRQPVADGRTRLVAARLRDGHGAWRDTESTISDQRGVPEVGALVVHMRDVGERRRLERTLHQLAFTDQLTGLANRRELMRTIVTQRAVPGHGGALLVIDLHGMAGINDVRGREVGDAVLIEVGRRLRATVGSDDVAARLAGDEFAVVTVEGPMLAYALATRLLTALTEPYQLPGAIVHLHVSIGLAEVSGGDSVDDVLRRADLARRRARQLGRNRVEWYDAFLEEQLVRRMDLERELPGAVERGELDLVYQPVIALEDGRPVGVEALLRWRSPMLGTVLPAELLPVAEDLALIDEIGRWVRQRACRQLAAWSRLGHDLWMAVNVSQRELAAPDFVSTVAATLAAHRIAPERLVVEIAESRVAADVPTVVTQLAGLRALGVRTALDDFGAGQASLAQLRRLPVDILKIDRALVADSGDRRTPSKPLIDVVVSLGRRLGLEILAEGLEATAQVDQAREAGCRFAQGHALARPAPAERVEAFLAEFHTPSV
ncbi:PAS domain S-box-containing protein/diguanylate cyclase (GGDEF) domain-containing protein [Micromonospora pattaloongensis]|uniref:PAS domain S-box-containing protein/diguanylate cyclase (GGDEF) domain-containing protein n=1 Tax=Micromonospora pattaloongensis TaxID=405436 RepID=A0A1H3KXT1_9ACTN|nr:EAL domain-containing protein [Micromonospora pattaloongensis]SDY56809.1 PAS domain S-box-containing protein/diguanylate cyclase (GGDEF) domain-containing protein [Micromonospora pattaloongensis]